MAFLSEQKADSFARDLNQDMNRTMGNNEYPRDFYTVVQTEIYETTYGDT